MFSNDCMSLTLRWACTAPEYRGKVHTYIWQPFRKPPPFAYVKIFVWNREDRQKLRILLLFHKRDSRTSFQESYAPISMRHLTDGVNWSPASEGLSAIIIAYRQALRETSEFLRQASTHIMALVRPLNLTLIRRSELIYRHLLQTFECRDDPSKLKMQYLIHLKDCLKRVPPDMQQNFAELQEVVEKMRPFISEATNLDGDLSNLQSDLDHILAELAKLKSEADDLVHQVIFPNPCIYEHPRELDRMGTDIT